MDTEIAQEYMPRLADKQLLERLNRAGAVLIEGPKWCGKTSTARQHAASALYMQDPDRTKGYLNLADTTPSVLLRGDVPRLLDEWQMAPVLWDAVRFEVDKRQRTGQFILTGSTTPHDDEVMHSGTGRISRMVMRPMSLYESGESNGSVSLSDLFTGKTDVDGVSSLTIDDIAKVIVRGGWPAAVLQFRASNEKAAMKHAVDYIESVIETDVSAADGLARKPERVRRLLRSFARNISTLASLPTIQTDILEGERKTGSSPEDDPTAYLSTKTIGSYIEALKRIFVIEDVPAWNPSLRSKTAMRTSPKRQFADPSLAVATLRISPERLFDDFQYFGFLFESLCTRDLRAYADALDGQVFYYHDRSELEADLILELADGRWGAIEVKMGNKEIEEAAANLLKLRDRVDLKKMGAPAFLMVLTGGEFAYTRADGVHVVPIATLRP